MIADPPFDDGAVQLTVACALPGVAAAPVGAPGTVRGITADEAVEVAPLPAMFVAVTANVYDVPLVSPVIAQVSVPAVVHVSPSGVAIAVYPVIADPPFEDGAVQVTVTWVFPATPVGVPGWPGTVRGVTDELAADAAPAPTAFVARTVKV